MGLQLWVLSHSVRFDVSAVFSPLSVACKELQYACVEALLQHPKTKPALRNVRRSLALQRGSRSRMCISGAEIGRVAAVCGV